MYNHKIHLFAAICCLLLSQRLQAQPATLDSTFGIQGKYTFEFPGTNTYGKAICLQQDGKILTFVQGSFSTGLVYIVRHSSEGEPDLTFGTGGFTTIAIPERRGYPVELKTQPDGKIIGIFEAEKTADYSAEIAVFRLLPSGGFDPDFGSSGIVRLKVNDQSTLPISFDIQPDGKILLAGSWDSDDNGFDAMIIRLNPEGSLDTSFGVGGYFFHTVSKYAEFIRTIVYHNEYLYVSGDLKDSIGDSRTVFLLKLKTDGTLDADFGNSGQVTYSPAGKNYLIVKGLAVLPDGKMLLAGDYSYLLDNTDFMLLRFKDDGSIDHSFGQNGIVRTQVEGDFNFVGSMLVQPDGKIILAGTTQYKCWCPVGGVARYEADGLLDMTFGNGGKMILDFGAYGDFEDIVLQDDGKILLTGSIYSYPPGASSLRYTAITCRLNNLVVSTNNRPAHPSIAKIQPNPVRQGLTNCHLTLNEPAVVTINLTDRRGRFIKPAFNGRLNAGTHQIPVLLGSDLPENMYFLEVRAGDKRQAFPLFKW